MKIRRFSLYLILQIAYLLFIFSHPAEVFASYTEQMAIDTVSLSFANACTAYPPGLMSIHHNPAGLSDLDMPGGWLRSNALIIPYLDIKGKFTAHPGFPGFFGTFKDDPLAGEETKVTSGLMYIPFLNETIDYLIGASGGAAYREPGSKWTFAIGNYAPFAVGVKRNDNNDPGRYGGSQVNEQHFIYLAPAVSYRVGEALSIGISGGAGQTALNLQQDIRNPTDMTAMTRVVGDATKGLEIPVLSELTLPPPWFGGGISPYETIASLQTSMRDDFSPSYNLGLLWEPRDWFSFGAAYQSQITAHVTGTYKITYGQSWQNLMHWLGQSPLLLIIDGMLDLPHGALNSQEGRITGDIIFPQLLHFGVSVKPIKRLRLLVDAHWANWSVYKQDKFIMDQNIQLLQFAKLSGYQYGDKTLVVTRDMSDTWTYSFGAELQLSDAACLRAGYERRTTSINPNYADLGSLPTLDDYGIGLGLKLPPNKKMPYGALLDLGAALFINRSWSIPENSSNNFNSLNWTTGSSNPYTGLDYQQYTAIYMFSLKLTIPFDFEDLHKKK